MHVIQRNYYRMCDKVHNTGKMNTFVLQECGHLHKQERTQWCTYVTRWGCF